jgi:lysophospholipase L1-like esterase
MVRPVPGAGRGAGPATPPGPPGAGAPTGPPSAPAVVANAPLAGPAGAQAPGAVAPAGAGRGGPAAPPVTFNNQTLRQIAHVSLGGDRVRVVLSNAFGTTPLRIGTAYIALRECADAKPRCARSAENAIVAPAAPLTVNGKTSFTILPGATLVTDDVGLKVPSLSDVVVDLFLPDDWSANTVPLSYHASAIQTAYLSAPGNVSGAPTFQAAATPANFFFLARVEVAAPANARVIVAFGDSITDGAQSTRNANSRWPDVLARRLAGERGARPAAVVNAGISGNRLLADGSGVNALARFDRDVLMQTGVTHVIVLEGINDIGNGRANALPTAEDIIAVHRQLIARAHAHGLKIIGGTLTPYEGAAYFAPEGEAKRKVVNDWIRMSGEYDGVIDFDKAAQDPAKRTWFLPANDSGDHLHPSDAGYVAMGNAIDLALFR